MRETFGQQLLRVLPGVRMWHLLPLLFFAQVIDDVVPSVRLLYYRSTHGIPPRVWWWPTCLYTLVIDYRDEWGERLPSREREAIYETILNQALKIED